MRLQFIEDLFGGSTDVGALVARAEPYGLNLAATHLVAITRTEQPTDPGARVSDWVQQAARTRFGGMSVLVTVKDGRLVCVLSTGPSGAGHQHHHAAQQFGELAGAAAAKFADDSSWRAGVSQPRAGPLGVVRGYREALEALNVADRLGLPDPVVHARQLRPVRAEPRPRIGCAHKPGSAWSGTTHPSRHRSMQPQQIVRARRAQRSYAR
jgi:sugar diacid utilization regulator